MSDSAQAAASVKAQAMLAEMHLNSQHTEVVKQEGIYSRTLPMLRSQSLI